MIGADSGATGSPRRQGFLFRPVSSESLGFFRVGFGLILAWEMWRFYAADWITQYYVEPAFHFTYFGFGWVKPLPPELLPWLFGVLGGAALLMAAGVLYRVAATLFFLGFSYVFLLEKARYLNHFYLVILLAFLMIFLPADRAWTLRSWRRGKSEPIPFWPIFLLRAQIGLVYFFAGVAKLNRDWLRARPLDEWLANRADRPPLGPLLAQPWTPWAFSYGGLLLDLLAFPLLLWRRTRAVTFVVAVAFHLTNSQVFGIGIFPWMMLVATTVFFAPDWPLRPLVGGAGAADSGRAPEPAGSVVSVPLPSRRRGLLFAALAVWLTLQVAAPLRHLLYPGVVSWTEEGHRFSWHMKLRGKDSDIVYEAMDRTTGQRLMIDPALELEPWQIPKMAGRPDMILEYAHHLAARLQRERGSEFSVRVRALCGLNGRPLQFLVDPAADLTAERRGLHRYRWILPLEPPRYPVP